MPLMSTEPASPDLYASEDFWEEHKGKILLYGSVLLIALAGFGIYEFKRQTTLAKSQAAYAEASTVETLQAVTKDFPGTNPAGNAALEAANKLRAEGKYDEAATLLRDFIAKYPEHPLAPGGWLSLGATQELQLKTDDAIETYQQTAAKFPESYAAPAALVAQARLLAAKGNKEGAARLYEDIAARFPESLYAREALREAQLLKR